MADETNECPACNGSGGRRLIVPECCGHFSAYGECCNDPDPKEEFETCEFCGGSGALPVFNPIDAARE